MIAAYNLPKPSSRPSRILDGMRLRLTLLIAFGLFSGSTALMAAEVTALQGAEAVLKSLAENAKETEVKKPMSASTQLRVELTNFSARVASLPAATAAQEWLAFYDRLKKSGSESLNPPSPDRERAVKLREILLVIPPPSSWSELSKAILSRPINLDLDNVNEHGLRMLAHALNGDRAALTQASADFEALLLKASQTDASPWLSAYRELDRALLGLSDDPKAILSGVERALASVERGRDYGYGSISIPDLVGLLGEEQATPYLRRALISKARYVTFEGDATRSLAGKIALSVIEEMTMPRWSLVYTLDSGDLYEAMDKKFSPAKKQKPTNAGDALADLENGESGGDYERQSATTYYLMGLIVKGKIAEAAELARRTSKEMDSLQIESSAVKALERAGYTAALDDFLYELLSKSPELSYWGTYFDVAAKTGATDRMLTLARGAAAKPDLAREQGGQIRQNLYQALLAADLIDEGVRELRALLASAPKETLEKSRGSRRSSRNAVDWHAHALSLARLGRLLERPEWTEEGLAIAKAQAALSATGADDYDSTDRVRKLVEEFIRSSRWRDAEELLADRLMKGARQVPSQRGFPGLVGMSRSLREPLSALLGLYHQAKRSQDVLTLLEKSPQWGGKDLVDLISQGGDFMDYSYRSFAGHSFAKAAKGNMLAAATANALVQAGRKSEARAVVDFMLNEEPGDDRAYELLIELAGQDAIPRLEALFARDPFEERPLIWKALLLHRANKDEEAEKVARQAIAIDPSDGEQPKGDRMRVYSVLADIRDARGDSKEAEFLRGVVRAIRLSERADEFMEAGLLTRGVRLYQDSLKHFTDAYCIQSRLAVQLTALGKHEEAAKHYEKAFELMPDSFGRVESHCFGCEGAFGDSQAQGVAERVFAKLVAKDPIKPQVHYLLGYLRQQQGRWKEALPHFRRAIELDPDYLNAWKCLGDIGSEYRLSSSERDSIVLNLLRLDPLGRHAPANFSTVSDLRKLWTAVETASKARVSKPASLFPLPASRNAMEAAEKSVKSLLEMMPSGYTRFSRFPGGSVSPGEAIAQHGLISAIEGLMRPAGESRY